ncbi:MAG: 50S ribosomal protein L4 [Phycisphaerae bacterium]|nr:50S ribosomal protein L4 [Phycisphaerae bacterium]
MIEIPVYSSDGKKTSTIKLDEQLLGGEVRPALLKQAYVMYHANRRQGSATTRSRGMKEGSTRKLYRQKGTGNARMGAARTNVRRGGGVAFAKQPKSWRQRMPVKMRRLAARNAVLSKAVDGELKIIDRLGFDTPKTKRFAGVLEALGINRTCLLALDGQDVTSALSARNIADVQTINIEQINAYDLLSRRFFLVEKEVFTGWLDGQTGKAKAREEAA